MAFRTVLCHLPSCQPPYYPGACDGGMANRYHVLEFCFEHTMHKTSVLCHGKKLRVASGIARIFLPVEVL